MEWSLLNNLLTPPIGSVFLLDVVPKAYAAQATAIVISDRK
jgi:hypothetical protein